MDLAQPVVELVKQYKDTKDIAILAYTNEEIMQIYSLLQENGIDAKFIIDRENFKLKNIIELYEFNKLLNSCIMEDETQYKESYFEQSLEIIEKKI
ncbi:MAG: hypothetical protein Q9M39_07745 [Sulfurovum sp.]|nr:hypothetical protein [Sulfurovum sp.]